MNVLISSGLLAEPNANDPLVPAIAKTLNQTTHYNIASFVKMVPTYLDLRCGFHPVAQLQQLVG